MNRRGFFGLLGAAAAAPAVKALEPNAQPSTVYLGAMERLHPLCPKCGAELPWPNVETGEFDEVRTPGKTIWPQSCGPTIHFMMSTVASLMGLTATSVSIAPSTSIWRYSHVVPSSEAWSSAVTPRREPDVVRRVPRMASRQPSQKPIDVTCGTPACGWTGPARFWKAQS